MYKCKPAGGWIVLLLVSCGCEGDFIKIFVAKLLWYVFYWLPTYLPTYTYLYLPTSYLRPTYLTYTYLLTYYLPIYIPTYLPTYLGTDMDSSNSIPGTFGRRVWRSGRWEKRGRWGWGWRRSSRVASATSFDPPKDFSGDCASRWTATSTLTSLLTSSAAAAASSSSRCSRRCYWPSTRWTTDAWCGRRCRRRSREYRSHSEKISDKLVRFMHYASEKLIIS